MDDLSRIERNYGSVAEYNRVRYEEDADTYEPSRDEQIKASNDHAVYVAKIKCLDGVPSDFAKSLKSEWDAKAPKDEDFPDRNSAIYAGYDWSKNRTLDVVNKICEHYGVESDDTWESYYRPGVGKFGISVEYNDHGKIEHKHIGGLDYDTFKDVFRDLYACGQRPSMSYEKQPEKPMLLSNCSLGNLRIYDLKMAGVETEESIAKSLEEAGFDEKAVIKENMKIWERELPDIDYSDDEAGKQFD